MARYRLKTKHFIEPEMYQQDEVIDYDGPPNEEMEPLDEAAKAAMKKYFETHIRTSVDPVMGLPRFTASVVVPEKVEPGVRHATAPKVVK